MMEYSWFKLEYAAITVTSKSKIMLQLKVSRMDHMNNLKEVTIQEFMTNHKSNPLYYLWN
jgi:hypothetical protein